MSGPQPGMLRRWWPHLRRALGIVFFAGVGWLVFTQVRGVDWGEVLATLQRRPVQGLLRATAFAALSFALYSCFDLLGRHVTAHSLGTRQVMAVNFVCYAFNLNIGALLGGVAFRYRLYARLGLAADVITRIVVISMMTNWLGYLLLAGLVFLCWPPLLWGADAVLVQACGVALLIVPLVYLYLCANARRRSWHVRGYAITLPSLRLSLLQLLMSSLNWILMAAAIFTLLEQRIAFSAVLGALFAAAIAGVITHVPAGLGVLEAVFLALLSQQIASSELLAALLAYRAIYYLAPLALAAVLYLLMEARSGKCG